MLGAGYGAMPKSTSQSASAAAAAEERHPTVVLHKGEWITYPEYAKAQEADRQEVAARESGLINTRIGNEGPMMVHRDGKWVTYSEHEKAQEADKQQAPAASMPEPEVTGADDGPRSSGPAPKARVHRVNIGTVRTVFPDNEDLMQHTDVRFSRKFDGFGETLFIAESGIRPSGPGLMSSYTGMVGKYVEGCRPAKDVFQQLFVYFPWCACITACVQTDGGHASTSFDTIEADVDSGFVRADDRVVSWPGNTRGGRSSQRDYSQLPSYPTGAGDGTLPTHGNSGYQIPYLASWILGWCTQDMRGATRWPQKVILHLSKKCSDMSAPFPFVVHCTKMHNIRWCEKCKKDGGTLFRLCQSDKWDRTAEHVVEVCSSTGLYQLDYDLLEAREEDGTPVLMAERARILADCERTIRGFEFQGILRDEWGGCVADRTARAIKREMANEDYRSGDWPVFASAGHGSGNENFDNVIARNPRWWCRPKSRP